MKEWLDIRHPRNLSDAAHSIVYFVAAAVADAAPGGFTWEHMDAAKMADPCIARLQDLVEVDPNPPPLTNPRFVHLDGGRVSIVTTAGATFTRHVQLPSGSGGSSSGRPCARSSGGWWATRACPKTRSRRFWPGSRASKAWRVRSS